MEQHIKNWDNIGTLRIGASITIGTHILPELIKKYQKHNPDLRLEVIVNKSSAIEQHILDNKIDIGLIENQSEHPDIILRPFMEDTLCNRSTRLFPSFQNVYYFRRTSPTPVSHEREGKCWS